MPHSDKDTKQTEEMTVKVEAEKLSITINMKRMLIATIVTSGGVALTTYLLSAM